MFHAESGLKKGPAVSAAKRMVRIVGNTRIISGRSSIQGILKELGTAYTQPGGKVIKGSTAFICSSELSSSIVEDKVATTILTDLYDRNYNVGEWRSLLKMESFDLRDPTITMLTATNEAHSDAFFLRRDIKGGYFARTFIIYESQENRSNSLLVPLQTPINYDKDADYLKQLARLQGEFRPLAAREEKEEFKEPYRDRTTGELAYYSPAGIVYQSWYDEFKLALRSAKDPTGTLNRFGDSVLKVAMLLSLAREPTLSISEEAMTESIKYCESLVGNVRKATFGKTEDEGTNAIRKTMIIHELLARENHAISREAVNRKFWLQGNPKEWDECISSFVEAGVVRLENAGSQVIIRMIPEEVKKYEHFFKGK